MVDPIQTKYREKMNVVAEALDNLFNPDIDNKETGFALLIFPFGEDISGTSRVNYISNAERDDIIVAMKEFIARNEGRYIESETNGKSH